MGVRLVVEAAFADPEVSFVIAATEVGNAASFPAFAKDGFRHDPEFDDVPSGRFILMTRRRAGPHEIAATAHQTGSP